MDIFGGYQSAVEYAIIAASLALSQYVVLRAGVFSLAPIGFAAVGGYAAGMAAVHAGIGFGTAMAFATILSVTLSVALGALLSSLRGVFQGVATLAFVLVVQAAIIGYPSVTGGVYGTNGIPKVVGLPILLAWLSVQVLVLLVMDRRGVTLSFDAVRSDEAASICHGIDVGRTHLLAFIVSGLFAGVTGGLYAFQNYSVVPSIFGFAALITVLAGAVLGGLQSLAGPILGAIVLAMLPEFARPLADYRELVIGFLLILVMVFLPGGLVQRRFIVRVRSLFGGGGNDGAVTPEGSDRSDPGERELEFDGRQA